MKIEITTLDLQETELNALTEYICLLADKIKNKSGNFSYFESRDVAHGEMAAEFETDVTELYQAGILMQNFIAEYSDKSSKRSPEASGKSPKVDTL